LIEVQPLENVSLSDMDINSIPIVFAFDNNLAMPAAVCFFSLFANAQPTTTYQVYIMHRMDEVLDTSYIDKVFEQFPMHSLKLIEVDDTFDSGYEVRGITTPTYYRLLIPALIPEHDKVIYSDVDVIFRQDLTEIYYHTDIGDNYYVGVNALTHLDKKLSAYYTKLRLDPAKIIYAGNLLINCHKFRKNPAKTAEIMDLSANSYQFQDMDVINIACKGNIGYIGPVFCLSTDISIAMTKGCVDLSYLWSKSELEEAKNNGIIHYNGQKPWREWCLNFDIWWEYYRKSPIFDENFYFRFYYNRLEELDTLPLMKRVKNLVRYFVRGRKKLI